MSTMVGSVARMWTTRSITRAGLVSVRLSRAYSLSTW